MYFLPFYKKILRKNPFIETVPYDKGRLIFVELATISIFLIILLRLIYVSLMGDYYNEVALKQAEKIRTQASTYGIRRNNILDRNGRIIATDISTVSLYANIRLLEDPFKTAKAISETLKGSDFEYIYNKLTMGQKKKSKNVLLYRHLTPKQQDSIKNLGIASMVFDKDLKRVYPDGRLFSHLVGYTDIDRNGISGVESEFNGDLSTTIEEGGQDVCLTIDTAIQGILYKELRHGMKKFKAKSVAGIVLDANNSEVLGMVSLPDFNPNRPYLSKDYEKFNRTTYGVYEMGSVFKLYTVAMGLDTKKIKLSDKYDVSEPIKYDRFTIRDMHFTKKMMDVEEILTQSSNIGTAKIIQDIGYDVQKDYFKKLGLLDKIDMPYPSLGKPLYPDVWVDIQSMTISFGHGIAVTALHVAPSIASLINGGYYNPPKIVMSESNNLTTHNNKPNRVISEETSKTMRHLMRKVVKEGTGWRANLYGYEVGGKTGTAEIVRDGKYVKDKVRTVFTSAFPMSNPKYVVVVMAEEPDASELGRQNTGGSVSAPIAARIISNVAPLLNVEPVFNN